MQPAGNVLSKHLRSMLTELVFKCALLEKIPISDGVRQNTSPWIRRIRITIPGKHSNRRFENKNKMDSNKL